MTGVGCGGVGKGGKGCDFCYRERVDMLSTVVTASIFNQVKLGQLRDDLRRCRQRGWWNIL